MHEEDDQIMDILSFWKHFMTGTALLKNEILQRCMKYLVLNYKKRLLLRCIHHFNFDLINNMDHMRISGNEPSSVILGQTK